MPELAHVDLCQQNPSMRLRTVSRLKVSQKNRFVVWSVKKYMHGLELAHYDHGQSNFHVAKDTFIRDSFLSKHTVLWHCKIIAIILLRFLA